MKFSKYQGAGNDFIVIEDHKVSFLPEQIRDLCNRHYGIGGDGLILARKHGFADAEMEIFNADGNRAEMCGNGLRCLIRYLIDKGLQKATVTVRASKKSYKAFIEGEDIVIDMGAAHVIEEGRVVEGLEVHPVHTGTSHIVHFCNESDWKDFHRMAKRLRHHASFSPLGVNVNFVKFCLSSPHLLQVRTYERGVENETLSCGTGGAAACVATWKKYGITGRFEVEFYSKERLQFDLFTAHSLLKGIYMRGRARCVFEGNVKV